MVAESGDREGEGPFNIEVLGLGEAMGLERKSTAIRSSYSNYG